MNNETIGGESGQDNSGWPSQDVLRQLRGECGSCFALCCVALYCSESQGFPADKAAGQPCRHLLPDFRCNVHPELAKLGLGGCVAYDCFGAGQKVSRKYPAGHDWINRQDQSQQILELFLIVHHLQEMLFYLYEAAALEITATIHDKLGSQIQFIERLTSADPHDLLKCDVESLRSQVRPLLLQTSRLVRQSAGSGEDNGSNRRFKPRSNLSEANLKGMKLIGLNLRSACLIAADLRDTDLSGTDLLGTDLRGTDIRGANLAASLFVNHIQLHQAQGDFRTLIPPHLERPSNWTP